MPVSPEDPFPISHDLIQTVRHQAELHKHPEMAHRAIDWAVASLVQVAPLDIEMHELYLGILAKKISEQ